MKVSKMLYLLLGASAALMLASVGLFLIENVIDLGSDSGLPQQGM